jgi:cupin 2 domain-containing protein
MREPDANLFTDTVDSTGEDFRTLLETGHFTLVRIASTGQATPAGEWYDQAESEWVVLLRGRAGLRFEDEAGGRTLEPGDFIHIAAHRRHRVEWTDAAEPTVWLALHYRD